MKKIEEKNLNVSTKKGTPLLTHSLASINLVQHKGTNKIIREGIANPSLLCKVRAEPSNKIVFGKIGSIFSFGSDPVFLFDKPHA